MTHGSFVRGGFAHGGFAHGGFGRGGSGHSGFARGGYGYRYGPGWRGYGWGPYWGWGLGLGLYLSALPWDYATYWWDGVPYYYTGDDYYVWDGNAARYEPVQPPPQVTQQAANAPPPHLYAYPKNGQSAQQQARDQTQCRSWASQQAGAPTGARGPGSEYLRAEAACLQGRGYSVD